MKMSHLSEEEICTSWGSSVALEKDEKIVDSWRGTREIMDETSEGSSEGKKVWKVKEKRKGFLVLTNQRLLFLDEQQVVENNYDQVVAVPLVDVSGMWMERVPVRSIPEKEGFETHAFRLVKVGNKGEFEEFKRLIEEYSQIKKNTTEGIET
jgi:hypothetical protein